MGLSKLSIIGLIALVASIESAHFSGKSPLKKWQCPEKDPEGVTTRFPHETDCHKYYQCDNGKLIEKVCEDGLNFDPYQKDCDFIDDVQCYTTTVTAATETPSTITTQESTKTTHTEIPTTVTVAPTETTTKVTTPVTDPTTTVAPTESTPIKTTTTAPTTAPITKPTDPSTTSRKPETTTTTRPRPEDCIGTCPAKDPEYSVQIPHKDCNKFCKCANGRPFVMLCPSGLEFNADLQTCVFPWQSTCPDHNLVGPISKKPRIQKRQATYSEPISEEEATVVPLEVAIESFMTTEPAFNPKTCIGGCPDLDPLGYTVQLPNEACDKFCKCANGQAYVIPCPDGLEYNHVLEVCTWPSQANCMRSTTPWQTTKTPTTPTTSTSTTQTTTTQSTTTVEDLATTLSPVPFQLLMQKGRKANDTSKSVLLLKIVEDKDQDTGLIDKFKKLFNFQ